MQTARSGGETTTARSKIYSVDASRMMSKINGLKMKQKDRFSGIRTMSDAFNDFAYDIGKTDMLHPAIGYVAIGIYCLFYVVAASGYAIPLVTKEEDEIAFYFFKFFTYFATFCPDTASSLVQLTVALQIFIVIAVQNLFTLYMIKKYQREDYPSTTLVDIWMIMGRVVSPVFSCYSAYAAAHGLVQLIFDHNSELGIMMAAVGIPAFIFQVVLVVLNAIIQTSTPLLRKNDPVSLWYAYTYFEIMGHGLIMGTSILQRILNLLSNRLLAAIIHLVLNSCCGIGSMIFIISAMPFTRPQANSFVLSIFFFTTLLGISPVLALKTDFLGYALLVSLALFFIALYVSGWVITKRMKFAVRKFYRYHYEMERLEEEKDEYGMNVLCDLGGPMEEPSLEEYGFKSAGEIEIAIRIGFLYHIDDATSNRFLQDVYQAYPTNAVLLAMCQVLTAVETDSTLLMTICKHSQYQIRRFMNGGMFLRLVNDLRLERLSPKNQPLMESFAKAKSATKVLSDDLSDFWTAALKGRTDIMVGCLPIIAVQMRRAENVYEKNVRNFPNTPLLLREIAGYYRTSIGDHKKCLVYQSMYHKSKKLDQDAMLTTTTTTALQMDDNVDKIFFQKMEPYVAAQDAIMGVRSPTTSLLRAIVIVAFIGYMVLPMLFLGITTVDLARFEGNFTPVQTVTDLVYSLLRLIQLFRRRNLCEIDNVAPDHIESTGPVLATLAEFITVDAILPAIQKHMEVTKVGAERLLDYCKSTADLKRICEEKAYKKVVGPSTMYVTNYELFSSMNTALMMLLNTSDWANLNTDENLVFVFENFEECYQAINIMIQALEADLLRVTDSFKVTCYVLIAVVWVFPIIALLPMFLFAVPMATRELKSICKLICNFPKNELSSLRRFSTKSEVKAGRVIRNESYATTNRDEQTATATTQNQTEMHQKVVDSLSVSKRASVSMFLPFVIAVVIFCAMGCLISTIGIIVFYVFADNNIDLAVNTFRLYRVSASCPSSYVFFQELFAQEKMMGLSIPFIKERASYYVERLILNFDYFVFGDNEYDRNPGIFTSGEIMDHFVSSSQHMAITTKYSPVNGFLNDAYFGESCDTGVRMMHDAARYLLNITDTTVSYSFKDEFVYHFEHLIFAHLDKFFQDGRVLMQESTSDQLIRERETLIIVFVTMIILLIVVYFALVVPEFISLKQKLLAVRNLMLLISPVTILKTQSVMKWMTGESNKNIRADVGYGQMDQDFLKHIVNNSRCGLILMDNHLNVTFNNTFAGIVFRSGEGLIGKNIIELLEVYLMDPKKQKQINNLATEIQNMRTGRNQSLTYEFRSSVLNAQGSNMYILITVLGHQESNREGTSAGEFSMVIADRTTEYYQEALVADEKRKGNNLVASMMPPVIVQKRQEGQTDISFEVQTATVGFACICDFEDIMWDMTAHEVVQFLNAVYEEYDKELANFPEITKIRTTGSIYMIAAGLFSEYNCADILINYCLRCMSKIEQIIEDTGVTFQITMGLHTGGPIRCGVLGQTRPVFDILGEVINVAYRMTSTCIPGCIQISESTYDCVKYLSYQLRERGDVSMYGEGTIKGYLVSASVAQARE